MMLQTLHLLELVDYSAITIIANFATLVSTYTEGVLALALHLSIEIIFLFVGFSMIIEPYDSRSPTIHNPTLYFKYAVFLGLLLSSLFVQLHGCLYSYHTSTGSL